MEFLRGAWPELRDVRVEVAAMPTGEGALERWRVNVANKRITLFRVPIERLLPKGHDDAAHRRMAAEGAIFHAAAAFLGREPWELDPGPRF